MNKGRFQGIKTRADTFTVTQRASYGNIPTTNIVWQYREVHWSRRAVGTRFPIKGDYLVPGEPYTSAANALPPAPEAIQPVVPGQWLFKHCCRSPIEGIPDQPIAHDLDQLFMWIWHSDLEQQIPSNPRCEAA